MKWLAIRLGVFGVAAMWVWIFVVHCPRVEWISLFCSALLLIMATCFVLGEIWQPIYRTVAFLVLLASGFGFEVLAVSTIPDYYYSDDVIACYDSEAEKIYRKEPGTVWENPLRPSRVVCLNKTFVTSGYVGNTYFRAEFEVRAWKDETIANMAVLLDVLQNAYQFRSSCYPNDYDCAGDSTRFRNEEKRFLEQGGGKAVALYQLIKNCAGAIASYYPPEVRAVDLPGVPREYTYTPPLAWSNRQTWYAPETLKMCDFASRELEWRSLILRQGGDLHD